MIACFSIYSQNTSKTIVNDSVTYIKITNEQLRITNLIFTEHKQLVQIVPLLQQENANLQVINQTWVTTDSIKTLKLQNQQQMIAKQAQDLEKLKKSLRTSNSVLIGGSILLTGAIIILCTCLK